MTDAVYEWMKNLAVYYIFLTVVLELAPDGRYREHIKFFMGLLLLLLILSPLLQIFRLEGMLNEYFRQNMLEEEYRESSFEEYRERMEDRAEELEKQLEDAYRGTTEENGEVAP